MKGRVLIIAGSDPSGGAGLQADIKTVTMLGGYAMAAVTALTVQNTKGVRGVHAVPPAIIRDQIAACLEDIGADAVKIGMIGTVEAGEAILEGLAAGGWRPETAPLVLDPVLIATSGDALSEGPTPDFLRERLMAKASVVTPNADEAAALTGIDVQNTEDQRRAGEILLDLGAGAALVKGGHLPGDEVADYLVTQAEHTVFRNPRIDTTAGHGTGCTLASAIAAGLAQGMGLEAATARAIRFVRAALEAAPGFGAGAGPLGHARVEGMKEAGAKEKSG